MPLPAKYEEWSEVAQQRYQSLKKWCNSLHDYIDVNQDIMLRVQRLVETCVEKDAGDGALFVQAEQLIKDKLLTQTYH